VNALCVKYILPLEIFKLLINRWLASIQIAVPLIRNALSNDGRSVQVSDQNGNTRWREL
jgi:hypothetical protein